MPTTLPKDPSSPPCATSGPARRAAGRPRRRRLGDADVPARLGRPGRRRPRHRHRVDAPRRAGAGRRGRRRGAHRTSATTSAGSTRRGSSRWPTSRRPPCWHGSADRVARRLEALDATTRGGVGRRRVHAGRAGHVRPVHAHPRVRLLAARAGHPRRRRPARWRGRPGRPAGARRDGRRARLRRRQEGRGAAGLRACASSSPAGRPHGRRRGRRAGRRRRRAVRSADRHADDAGRRVRPPRRRPGRSDRATTQVGIDGDAELGERIVANMAYTI